MFNLKTFSAIGFTLFTTTAQAIVNMEDLHTGEPKEGFSGQVELSFNRSSGNSEVQEYSLGSRLQHHHNAITNYLLLSGSYGESSGVRNTEKGFLHGRHMRALTPTVTAEAYAQTEYDKFARLEFRGLLGGGARLTLLPRAEKGEAYLGLGAYYSEERIDETYADGGSETLWRANSYLVLKYQASDNTTLVSTTYYQPALDDGSDYRLMEQAALKVKMSDMLSLVVAVDYRRDSRPPIGVESEDVSYTTSLSLEF
jgi:putative salt-induced outer membrane protein YdiY